MWTLADHESWFGSRWRGRESLQRSAGWCAAFGADVWRIIAQFAPALRCLGPGCGGHVVLDVVATRLGADGADWTVVSGTSFTLAVRGENALWRGGCGLRAVVVGDAGDGLGGDAGRVERVSGDWRGRCR